MQHPLRKLYLLYHELRPNSSKYSYAIETIVFEQHMDLFVQMQETVDSGLYPEITFDDGHISNSEFALPILQSRGVEGAFLHYCRLDGEAGGLYGLAGTQGSSPGWSANRCSWMDAYPPYSLQRQRSTDRAEQCAIDA